MKFIERLSQQRIFSKTDELVNLFTPILLFFSAILLLIYSPSFAKTLGIEKMQKQILLNTILFGTTHNAFSFICLFFMKEFRPWKNARLGWSNRRKARGHALTFTGFVALSYVMLSGSSAYTRDLYIFLFLAFTTHHYLMQWKGLSLKYNGSNLSKGSLQAKTVVLEKWLFTAMIPLFLAIEGNNEINFSGFISGFPQQELATFSFYLSILVFAATLVNSFIQTKHGAPINKLLFNFRLILIPATYFSPVFFYIFIVWHGIEYLFVFRTFCRASETTQPRGSNSTRNRFLTLTLAGLLCVAFLRWGRDMALINHHNHTTAAEKMGFTFLAAFSFSVAYAHYLFDRLVFRMRNLHSKNLLSKLWHTGS